MKIKNSKGTVYYGLHLYPGVAEYQDSPDAEPYRIFLNEDTIRSMSPTFAGCPIYVEHVDEVPSDKESLKNEADGFVLESFYNPADGKTWAKFIVVSDRAEKAIRSGYKLSNAYVPKGFGPGGLWNGVQYAKEVTSGEFEHLAIVRNPRYEESRILTPDEFKAYNEEKQVELKRLANSKKEKSMLKFWEKKAVENTADLEKCSVSLPKSGKEVSITKLINDADMMEMNAGKEMMANGDHMVECGDKKMSVNDMVAMHKKMNDELDLLRDKKPADKSGQKDPDVESMDNKEDDMDKKLALEKAENEESKDMGEEKKENEEEKDLDKKQNALDAKSKKEAGKKHFNDLKNAHLKTESVKVVKLVMDKVQRGKDLFGSGR